MSRPWVPRTGGARAPRSVTSTTHSTHAASPTLPGGWNLSRWTMGTHLSRCPWSLLLAVDDLAE